jgi:hypothetical protein
MKQDERVPIQSRSVAHRSRPRWTWPGVSVSLVLLFVSFAVPTAGAEKGKEGFCRAKLGGLDHDVRDMRSIKPVPASGLVHVGTTRLSLGTFAERAPYPAQVFGYHVVLPGGSLRYRLKPATTGATSPVRVKTVLYATDRNGVPWKVEMSRWSRLGWGAESGKTFSSERLRRQGFYRLDIEIKGPNDQRSRFSEYVRVLKPTFGAKLQLSSSRIAPTAAIYGRLVNTGTAPLQYGTGSDTSVQRRTSNGWVRAQMIKPEPMLPLLLEFLPGKAGSCLEIRLPSDAVAGTYRIQQPVRASFTKVKGSVAIHAIFHVD